MTRYVQVTTAGGVELVNLDRIVRLVANGADTDMFYDATNKVTALAATPVEVLRALRTYGVGPDAGGG